MELELFRIDQFKQLATSPVAIYAACEPVELKGGMTIIHVYTVVTSRASFSPGVVLKYRIPHGPEHDIRGDKEKEDALRKAEDWVKAELGEGFEYVKGVFRP